MKKAELIQKYGEDWYRRMIEKQKEYSKTPGAREKRRESNKRYRKNHADSIAEYQNRPENREKAKNRSKKWYEEHKEYTVKRNSEYIQQHPEIKQKSQRNYRESHKEEIKKYNTSKEGRASHQAVTYKTQDLRHNRGVSTITQKWILENIYNNKCIYCKCDDWRELGCDRIDNNKPHTPENVVCSCRKCNAKRGKKSFEEFCKSIGLNIQ